MPKPSAKAKTHIPLVDTKPQKKRGRPKKVIQAQPPSALTKTSTNSNFDFSIEQENYLVSLRLGKYKYCFLKAPQDAALTKAWNKILLEFNCQFKVLANVDTLSRKFDDIVTSYLLTASKLERSTIEKSELPVNWDHLHFYFMHSPGLAGTNLGESMQRAEDICPEGDKVTALKGQMNDHPLAIPVDTNPKTVSPSSALQTPQAPAPTYRELSSLQKRVLIKLESAKFDISPTKCAENVNAITGLMKKLKENSETFERIVAENDEMRSKISELLDELYEKKPVPVPGTLQLG